MTNSIYLIEVLTLKVILRLPFILPHCLFMITKTHPMMTHKELYNSAALSPQQFNFLQIRNPDSKVHGANMGPTWVLSVPWWPHEPCYQGKYLVHRQPNNHSWFKKYIWLWFISNYAILGPNHIQNLIAHQNKRSIRLHNIFFFSTCLSEILMGKWKKKNFYLDILTNTCTFLPNQHMYIPSNIYWGF